VEIRRDEARDEGMKLERGREEGRWGERTHGVKRRG
jgi:hypothetical protein